MDVYSSFEDELDDVGSNEGEYIVGDDIGDLSVVGCIVVG